MSKNARRSQHPQSQSSSSRQKPLRCHDLWCDDDSSLTDDMSLSSDLSSDVISEVVLLVGKFILLAGAFMLNSTGNHCAELAATLRMLQKDLRMLQKEGEDSSCSTTSSSSHEKDDDDKDDRVIQNLVEVFDKERSQNMQYKCRTQAKKNCKRKSSDNHKSQRKAPRTQL